MFQDEFNKTLAFVGNYRCGARLLDSAAREARTASGPGVAVASRWMVGSLHVIASRFWHNPYPSSKHVFH